MKISQELRDIVNEQLRRRTKLFASRTEAHEAMMLIVGEVMQQLRQDGQKLPSTRMLVRMTRVLMDEVYGPLAETKP
jgi:hypothetical protein